jgi:hypothetical protein
MASGLYEFAAPKLHMSKIPDHRLFTTLQLRRFKIPDYRAFATLQLRRFNIPDHRAFFAPENLFHELR